MSAITDAARAALTQSMQARESEARAALMGLLSAQVAPAAVRVVETTNDLTVFTDGTVSLAVGEDGIYLVTGVLGDWTRHAGPLTDLADLGKALA